MEQEKIGEFIAAQRKEKQMTQKQLGEALGISNKTVSKWECGKGLPDVSIMIPLCELLEINVNELLSGEHLTEEVYSEKAEENMMHLIQETESRRKESIHGNVFRIVTWIMGIFLLLVFLRITTSYKLPFPVQAYFDVVSLAAPLFYMLLTLLFAGYIMPFFKSFTFLWHKAEDQKELQDSITALLLAKKALLLGGRFSTLFYTIYLLWVIEKPIEIGTIAVNIAVTLLPLLYALLGTIILLPVKGRLEKQQDDRLVNKGR